MSCPEPEGLPASPSPPALSRPEMLRLYRQMVAIRRMEEAAAKAYAQQKIGGFLHLYIGQESVAVGSMAAIRPEDYVVATYREHAHAYTKGVPARQILAELFGKATGCSKGLGGSMHMFDVSKGMLGGEGIVGGHIPIAAGTAFASKYRNDGRVTLCYFGDGSASQGAFHEGLSLAALWKLPVVFICENNLYSMGTPLTRSLSVADISQKALAYGMARDRFDGEDILRVHERIGIAVRRAREESLPTLVEIRTYRYRGHSMSDPGLYRTKEEIEAWKKRDCIAIARGHLEALGVSSQEFQAVDDEVKTEIEEAVRFAESSPELELGQLDQFTYKE